MKKGDKTAHRRSLLRCWWMWNGSVTSWMITGASDLIRKSKVTYALLTRTNMIWTTTVLNANTLCKIYGSSPDYLHSSVQRIEVNGIIFHLSHMSTHAYIYSSPCSSSHIARECYRNCLKLHWSFQKFERYSTTTTKWPALGCLHWHHKWTYSERLVTHDLSEHPSYMTP